MNNKNPFMKGGSDTYNAAEPLIKKTVKPGKGGSDTYNAAKPLVKNTAKPVKGGSDTYNVAKPLLKNTAKSVKGGSDTYNSAKPLTKDKSSQQAEFFSKTSHNTDRADLNKIESLISLAKLKI